MSDLSWLPDGPVTLIWQAPEALADTDPAAHRMAVEVLGYASRCLRSRVRTVLLAHRGRTSLPVGAGLAAYLAAMAAIRATNRRPDWVAWIRLVTAIAAPTMALAGDGLVPLTFVALLTTMFVEPAGDRVDPSSDHSTARRVIIVRSRWLRPGSPVGRPVLGKRGDTPRGPRHRRHALLVDTCPDLWTAPRERPTAEQTWSGAREGGPWSP